MGLCSYLFLYWIFSQRISKEKDHCKIQNQDKLVWDGLRKIRNAIAHNDSIASENGKIEYKSLAWDNKQFVLEYKKGKS